MSLKHTGFYLLMMLSASALWSYTDCALLQDDIAKLFDWSNKLAFNVGKCSLCLVSRKHNPIICNYNMGGKVLNRVEAQRDLRVLMSDKASFSDHIDAQVNKANKTLGFNRRTINGNKSLSPTLRCLMWLLYVLTSSTPLKSGALNQLLW